MKYRDLARDPMPFPPSWRGGPPDPPEFADDEEWDEPIRDPEAEAEADYHYRTEGL